MALMTKAGAPGPMPGCQRDCGIEDGEGDRGTTLTHEEEEHEV